MLIDWFSCCARQCDRQRARRSDTGLGRHDII